METDKIKFRGKSKLGLSPWVTGFFLEDENQNRFISFKPDNDSFQLTPIHYDSLGVFTGLKDKNGKEIYTDDILTSKQPDGGFLPSADEKKGFVEINVSHGVVLRYPDKHYVNGLGIILLYGKHNEVIGNKFDNIDLL